MGMFATWAYAAGGWQDRDPGGGPAVGDALWVDVHDDDVATVVFTSATAAGTCYLGTEPRVHVGLDAPPVDREVAAAGLRDWAAATTGADLDAAAVLELLPTDDDLEPRDVFVHETLVRLLDLLGTGRPVDLRDVVPGG